MNQFGSTPKLSTLAAMLLGETVGPELARYGQPAAPAQPPIVQPMQAGRLIDPMAMHGDGMQDATPAQINGHQPAALGSGEYVIPADVVSGLGNGSTMAGAKVLDQMAAQTRKMRTGGIAQAPQINPQDVLPR